MKAVATIFKREFVSYFLTPLAYVFVVIFLVATGIFTFYLGRFYESGQADLVAFFQYHPWLYLFFMPALAMRLWAEERKTGTIELLLTLPVPLFASVLGKFLAAWALAGLGLVLTFPIWITVNVLGNPDNGVILASYIGSFLMAGGYLAIGAAISALTKNQVIAFVVSVFACFLFTVSGLPIVLDFFGALLPEPLLSAIASLSALAHFTAIMKGVIDLRDIVYYTTLIGFFLFANTIFIDMSRAG